MINKIEDGSMTERDKSNILLTFRTKDLKKVRHGVFVEHLIFFNGRIKANHTCQSTLANNYQLQICNH